MREIISVLLRLQELELMQEENRILQKHQLEKKNHNIVQQMTELRSQIPPIWLSRFDVLKRTRTAVAREFGGTCQSCRISVPVGDLNRMHRDEMPRLCPNCGRFLLLQEH